MDAALMASDALEKDLQKRIAEVYGDALKRAVRNNRLFLTNVKKLDARAAELEKGGWTSEKIEKWRKEEVLRLLRQQRLVQNITDEMNRAGVEIAPEIKSRMAEVYKVNSDMTYQRINGRVNADFALIPKKQIPIILDDAQPVFSKIAYRHLGQNKTIRAALQREMAQAAILGESQDKIIKRIQKVTGQAEYQARRVAQTERNRVQSQARADALHEAAQAGVIVTKKWSARMRNTRDSHAALNGVEIPENEKFRTIWGNELRYPGDPEAPASEVINCHCVLIPDVKLPPENSAVRLKKEAESGIIEVGNNAPGFKAIQGKHDISDDIGTMQNPTCNPNFSTGQWGYTQNCQRCVQAYELRRRGYNVVATERPKKNNTIVWGYECFTDENGNPVKLVHGQTVSMIKKVLNSAPDGSRYTIYVKWKGRGTGAHVFIAEKENGVVRYIDPQSGNMNVASYFNRGSSFGYFRMDDKKLTTDKTIINAAMEEKK